MRLWTAASFSYYVGQEPCTMSGQEPKHGSGLSASQNHEYSRCIGYTVSFACLPDFTWTHGKVMEVALTWRVWVCRLHRLVKHDQNTTGNCLMSWWYFWRCLEAHSNRRTFNKVAPVNISRMLLTYSKRRSLSWRFSHSSCEDQLRGWASAWCTAVLTEDASLHSIALHRDFNGVRNWIRPFHFTLPRFNTVVLVVPCRTYSFFTTIFRIVVLVQGHLSPSLPRADLSSPVGPAEVDQKTISVGWQLRPQVLHVEATTGTIPPVACVTCDPQFHTQFLTPNISKALQFRPVSQLAWLGSRVEQRHPIQAWKFLPIKVGLF